MICKVPVFNTQADFYENFKADLMIVSTPIQFHREHTECAVKHCSHVLCEKPTSALLSDVKLMESVAQKHGKEIFVGFLITFI